MPDTERITGKPGRSELVRICRAYYMQVHKTGQGERVLSGVFLGKLLGRYAGVGTEYFAEIAGGVEAALLADLIDREVRVFQQHLPGTAYTDGGQVVHDGFAGLLAEAGAEVLRGFPGKVCDITEGDVFSVVFLKIEKDIRDKPVFLYLRRHFDEGTVRRDVQKEGVELLGEDTVLVSRAVFQDLCDVIDVTGAVLLIFQMVDTGLGELHIDQELLAGAAGKAQEMDDPVLF